MAAGVLAAGAGTFPPTKGLEARPGAGSGALRAVGITDADLNILEEPFDFFFRAIEARRQAVIHRVGVLHGLFQATHFGNCGNGQKHLMLPQTMIEWQVGNDGRRAEIPLAIFPLGKHFATGKDIAGLGELLGIMFIVLIRAKVDNRPKISGAGGWVANRQLVGHFDQSGNQLLIDRLLDENSGTGRTFLPLQAEG